MTTDRPRAALREFLNELALIRTGAAARGFTEAEIAAIERVWTGRRLAPARPVAPRAPDVEYGWKDGCWCPIGDETEADTN
jgi:hypothetical protein